MHTLGCTCKVASLATDAFELFDGDTTFDGSKQLRIKSKADPALYPHAPSKFDDGVGTCLAAVMKHNKSLTTLDLPLARSLGASEGRSSPVTRLSVCLWVG